MIPGERLILTAVPAGFTVRPNWQPSALRSVEIGGIALSDPSQGLEAQVWTLGKSGDDIVVTDESQNDTVLFTQPNVTWIRLAFDQNASPFVTFIQAGQAKYWGFDNTASAFVFTSLPSDVEYPCCTLDDPRPLTRPTSDIILSYIRADKLYYRQQRDKYLVEYHLKDGVEELHRIGAGTKNRLLFQCIES